MMNALIFSIIAGVSIFWFSSWQRWYTNWNRDYALPPVTAATFMMSV